MAGRSSSCGEVSSRVRARTTLSNSPARIRRTAAATAAVYAPPSGTSRVCQVPGSAEGPGSAMSGSSQSAEVRRTDCGTASEWGRPV